jgi:3-isopropylmalate/(R)-2-methylmalate dehydratase large subunit
MPVQKKSKTMLVRSRASWRRRHGQGHRAGRDRQDRHAGGTGYAIEFAVGDRALSMEGRMTVCNMSIEAGARAGMIAVDETTIDYLKGAQLRPPGRNGTGGRLLAHAADRRRREVRQVVSWTPRDRPQVTWGHVAADGDHGGRQRAGSAARSRSGQARRYRARAQVHGLTPNTPITEIAIDKVFIGSCTNSRIEDLRAAAVVARGKKVADSVKLALVVPGPGRSNGRLKRRDSTRFSSRPGSNGASRAARCAWA